MKLITLEQASDYIRRDSADDDDDLEAMIEAASALVRNYLKSAVDDFLDSDGEPDLDSAGNPVGIPAEVVGATKWLTAWLYRNRDRDEEKAFEPGFLPAPVMAMLYPLRDPALA